MPLMYVPTIPLVLGLISAAGAAAAIVATMRRNPKSAASQSTADSWEMDHNRRRRREAVYGGASYVLLFVCAAVAAAMSFHGLVGFGRENLDLSGGWEYLVPFGLDGAAMFCSVLAVREASHGDAAFASRFLVWAFAGASAWFNWVHAPRGHMHEGAPQFFAGMSIAAAVLFDRALKQTRKSALREQGLVATPLPQIRAARWLRAPRETYGAWSTMLLEGVRSLDEAVEVVRDEKRDKIQARHRARLLHRQERAQARAMHKQQRAMEKGRHRQPQISLTADQEQVQLPGQDAPVPVKAGAPKLNGGTTAVDTLRTSAATASRNGGRGTADPLSNDLRVDLTVEDEAQPKLDTLEQRLHALEKQLS